MRRRLARAAALLLMAAGLAVLPAGIADAASLSVEQTDVSDVKGHETISGKDGNVTAAGCSTASGTVGTKTIEPDGDVVGTTPIVPGPPFDRPAIYLCDFAKAVGNDGTLYGVGEFTYPAEPLIAYEPDGTQLWSAALSVPGCTSNLGVGYVRIGSDGNVYAVGMPWSGQCSNNPSLYSFTPTGTLRWQVQLTSGQQVSFIDAYSANSGGLVLKAGSAIKYFDYAGNLDADVSVPSGSSIMSINEYGVAAVTSWGWSSSTETAACGWSSSRYVNTNISTYAQTGQVIDFQPACTRSNVMVTLANGDVVYQDGFTDTPTQIVRLHYNVNTNTTTDHSVMVFADVEGERTFNKGVHIIADTNGNVLSYRTYTRESGKYRGGEFRLFNGINGSETMKFYTDVIDREKSIHTQGEAISLAPGRLSFVATMCDASWSCSGSPPDVLMSLPVAEIGMDYPRGTALGVTPVLFDAMAVAGDSFTSGVGTLRAGEAYQHVACARSSNSYGYTLSVDPTVKLYMPADSFVACSGAKTVDMTTNTQVAGQGPQIGRIPSSTKVVFLTIGGNDVGFGRLGALCIFVDCTLQGYKDVFNGNLVGLDATLASVYEAIAAQAPNAHIYVLNYPHILPQEDCDNSGSAWWIALGAARLANPAVYENMAVEAGLTPAEGDVAAGAAPTITNDEITWARQFENSLNLKVSDAVDLANDEITGDDRVHLVLTTLPGSPLEGHELCSYEPYFNGLDGATSANTFHPNAAGQAAMYQLAREALEDHQPQYVLAG